MSVLPRKFSNDADMVDTMKTRRAKAQSLTLISNRTDQALHETEFSRMGAGEYPLNTGCFQAKHPLQQACEHGAIVG